MEGTNNIGLINADLKPAADVTNNIIDKFSSAVGWLATSRGSRRDTEIAVETYINDIQNDKSLNPLVKAAKISNARKEIKEYINLQDILQHAQEFAQEYECESTLNEDWAMFFYDKAKNVSREDAKIIWGKILAGECHSSGSIPKQLVHILSIMSEDDSKAFDSLCGFAVNKIYDESIIGESLIIIGTGMAEDDILERVGLSLVKLEDLQSLGLIQVNLVDKRFILECENLEEQKLGYEYHGHIIEISNLRKETPIGYVSFTASGLVLSSIIVKKEIKGFLSYIKKYYEKNEFTVNILSK